MGNIIRLSLPCFIMIILVAPPLLDGAAAPGSLHTAQALLPGAKPVGRGRFSYLGWSVYDAALFSRGGTFSFKKPFLLSLHYHMDAKGGSIARLSVRGMRDLGYQDEVRLAAWFRQMKQIFPDVREGTQLNGLYTPQAGTKFYQGRRLIGTIRDPRFGAWFFRIWLGKNSRLKVLRRQLLGMR